MKDNIMIRRAKETDQEIIVELWSDFMSLLQTKSPHNFPLRSNYIQEYEDILNHRFQKDNFLILLAKFNQESIGYCITCIRYPVSIFEQKPFGQITDLFIRSEYRGMGAGTELISRCIDWLQEKKVDQIQIKTLSENKEGIAFWKKNGFTPSNIRLKKSINI